MTIPELKETLLRRAQQSDDDFVRRLEPRKVAELTFHDDDRNDDLSEKLSAEESEQRYGNRRFYIGNRMSTEYWEGWIARNVPNKIVLDLACGDGPISRSSARCGAGLVIGIELSNVSVEKARRLAEREGLEDRTIFLRGDAENTLLPENSVDVIICSGVLHHLDLNFAYPEMFRILKPGGKILAIEALNYNPVIKLYRLLTPVMRTEWEKKHILSLKDVRFASRFFRVGEVRFWHLVSYLAAFAPRLLTQLEKCDAFLTRIPVLQLWSWMFTFELTKPAPTTEK